MDYRALLILAATSAETQDSQQNSYCRSTKEKTIKTIPTPPAATRALVKRRSRPRARLTSGLLISYIPVML